MISSGAIGTRPRVVCFGEVLLRLAAPGRELLMQTPRLDVHVGGAEANVAVGLACLGHRAAMVSIVPDNRLGAAAIGELRKQGVDCTGVRLMPGRMGLYFLSTGAGLRVSDIVYDRSHSAFAEATVDAIDWPMVLNGAEWLHLSGITPALGPSSAEAALRAVQAARAAGVRISFDGNYRAKLWEAWDGNPRALLTPLVSHAELFFGNHRDVMLLLGRSFDGTGEHRRREAAESAFAAFPNLRLIASTARQIDDADHQRISARIDTPHAHWQTAEVPLSGIVDRIGTGDAFAAGVLHSLLLGRNEAAAVRDGLALSCLNHSVPGDASLFFAADLDAYHEGSSDVRR